MSNVRTRYFVLDNRNRLHKASQRAVEGIWFRKRPIADLKIPVGDVLRIATVVCDAKLRPIALNFLRLDMRDGAIEQDSRHAALQIVVEIANCSPARRQRLEKQPLYLRHLEGWPEDIFQQLVVALDVSPTDFARCPFEVGGPLPSASCADLSIREYLKYYEPPSYDRT